LLGDVYVGKTSIALRFAKDEFSDFLDSTIGAVFLPHAIELNDSKIKFDIWDTAGQERFRSLAPMYYKGSRAAIVVYDITVQVYYCLDARILSKELRTGLTSSEKRLIQIL